MSEPDDIDPIRIAGDDGDILDESRRERERFEFTRSTCYQRGREQSRWIVHRAGSESTDCSLSVWQDGVVESSRTVPYDGQRRYSTEDRQNRADKSSQYRLTVEAVLNEYVERGEPAASVEDLRERVLAALRPDDVAANMNGEIDLLTDVDD